MGTLSQLFFSKYQGSDWWPRSHAKVTSFCCIECYILTLTIYSLGQLFSQDLKWYRWLESAHQGIIHSWWVCFEILYSDFESSVFEFFLNFFNLKRIIRTPKLCNKNIDHYARLRAILLSRTFSRDLKQSRLRDGPKQIVLHTALSTYLSWSLIILAWLLFAWRGRQKSFRRSARTVGIIKRYNKSE